MNIFFTDYPEGWKLMVQFCHQSRPSSSVSSSSTPCHSVPTLLNVSLSILLPQNFAGNWAIHSYIGKCRRVEFDNKCKCWHGYEGVTDGWVWFMNVVFNPLVRVMVLGRDDFPSRFWCFVLSVHQFRKWNEPRVTEREGISESSTEKWIG